MTTDIAIIPQSLPFSFAGALLQLIAHQQAFIGQFLHRGSGRRDISKCNTLTC